MTLVLAYLEVYSSGQRRPLSDGRCGSSELPVLDLTGEKGSPTINSVDLSSLSFQRQVLPNHEFPCCFPFVLPQRCLRLPYQPIPSLRHLLLRLEIHYNNQKNVTSTRHLDDVPGPSLASRL